MFMQAKPFNTIRASRPLTEIEFCAWVAQATPGDRLEYHRGYLALDIHPMFKRLADRERENLAKLGSRAFWAAQQELVHLVQQRLGPEQFAYIAIARPKPETAGASLSALLLEDLGPPCDATSLNGRAAA